MVRVLRTGRLLPRAWPLSDELDGDARKMCLDRRAVEPTSSASGIVDQVVI